VFVFLTLLMLLSGTAIGYLYSRLSQTNLLTAMLATVPGGIGVMASIAADYGRNVTQVALVQVLRITAVILLIPFVAKSLAGQPGASAIPLGQPSFHFNLPYLGLVGLSLLAVVGGVAVAKRLRIPAAFFFGAVVVGIGFNPLLQAVPGFSAVEFTPPPLLGMLGNILLGLTIGEYWGSGFTLRKRAIAHALLPVVLTILAGLLTAWIAMRLTSWDWLTCLLVTAPGGAPEMILAALALHHNVETVTAGHLVRLMAINASLPLWVWLFRALDRTTTAGAEGSPQPAGSSH
jgi:membrane AbrB-like protein